MLFIWCYIFRFHEVQQLAEQLLASHERLCSISFFLVSILGNINERFCKVEHKYWTDIKSGNKPSPTILSNSHFPWYPMTLIHIQPTKCICICIVEISRLTRLMHQIWTILRSYDLFLVSAWDRKASIKWTPWPTRGCCAMEKKNLFFTLKQTSNTLSKLHSPVHWWRHFVSALLHNPVKT
jgi:hypothetical protein